MADDEFLDEEAGYLEEDDAAPAARSEFIPEVPAKPKPDIYSAILILTFVLFLTGIFLAGKELHEYYDVNFFILSKNAPAASAK